MKVKIVPAYVGWLELTPQIRGHELYYLAIRAKKPGAIGNGLFSRVLRRSLRLHSKARRFRFKDYLKESSESIWILDRVVKELIDRLDYTHCYDEIGEADINYYVNWHAFKKPATGINMALFTHYEPRSKEAFFSAARSLDYCVCMSKKYEHELRDEGIKAVTTIPLGVDLELFKPKLILGCVGSFSLTQTRKERKGFEIIEKLRELDWVEVRITEGRIRFSELPNFYRELDYVLVPSSIEGGPMCLPESLACGIPVVAPSDVGAVSEYSEGVIHYRNSDFESLKAVLEKLYEKKLQLRRTVEHLTWDYFAKRHDELFRSLVAEGRPIKLTKTAREQQG